MSDWSLAARLLLSRLGRGTLALAVLVLATGVIWLWLLPAAEHHLAREARRVAAWREQAAVAAPAPAAAVRPDALALFEQRLATDDDRNRLMKQLWEHGTAAGLQLSQVDYRTAPGAEGRFNRLLIKLPMTGPYPAVRRFLFGLMAAFPGLSLDQLDIKRDQSDKAEVEVDAHMTLHLRP